MPGDKELRTILADTCSRLFTAQVTPQLQESAEKGTWPEALWRQVEENGLTLPQVPESRGGAGGSWSDAHVVLTTAGRHAVPLPIAETMMGGWLLAQSGLDVPMGPITLAPTSVHTRLTLTRNGKGWRLEGSAPRVPWGRQAEHVVVAAEDEGRPMIALVARGAASVEEDVQAPVGLAGRALRLARSRDAVDQLERRPLRARDRDRVAPEGGHGEDRLLPPAGGDGRAAEGGLSGVGRQRGRGGEPKEEAGGGQTPALLR